MTDKTVSPVISSDPPPLAATPMPKERRFIDALAMFIVALTSLCLLVYVAYGEAKRTYEQFQIDKLVAQSQVVHSAVETFVRPGLPISQFVGFNGLAEPMVKADPLIDGIAAFDANNKAVFVSGEVGMQMLPESDTTQVLKERGAYVRASGNLMQVIVPVRNRFELVGYVVASSPRSKIAEQVEEAFRPVIYTGLGGSVAFALFVFFFSHNFAAATRRHWVAGGFVLTFMAVAILVISTLVNVYSQGAQARTKSLADSLGLRLDDLVLYNINMDDITGIIALFGEYKRLNPDLRSAALILDGKVRAHSDQKTRGVEWESVSSDHEYTVRLSPEHAPREVLVKVAIPGDIVFQQVFRSVKNFAALFVASGFFAALFMGLARSLQLLAAAGQNQTKWTEEQEKATIDLIKPVFFLAVFLEHMSYAFLPSLMQTYVAEAGLSSSYASAPFMLYYLCFALSLIPSGRIEARIGARSLMLIGLMIAAFGMIMMANTSSFWMALAARAAAGCGQGMLFIGVQAYVLANSSPSRRTQGGAAIVFGFQAGMIAGMAIGSLLVSYVGASGIFTLGATIALVTALYGWLALPSKVSGGETMSQLDSAWRDMARIFKDGHFNRTMLLVGVPAKAILTGVVLFALPLLLAKQGFVREDIGQITMAYAGAVIIASHFMAQKADRSGDTERILFHGACLTGAGLVIISLAGFPNVVNWSTNSGLGTFVIVAGVIMVGVAHGFINAPIVTHVTDASIANQVGATNVAAAYRLLERIGHVMGPLIMGQVFLYQGVSWVSFAVIGCITFLLGALFLSSDKSLPASDTTRSV
jgi:predicted MFS family arabinose efflux permease